MTISDPQGYRFVSNGEGWEGEGVRARLEPGLHPRRFTDAVAWLDGELPPEGVAFASFTFDPQSAGSAVAIPEVVRRVSAATNGSGGTRLVPARGKVRYAGASIDEVAWMEAVAEATRRIHEGRYDKVVLARDVEVWAEQVLDPILLADRLAERFPACMTFMHEGFIGATPELLVRREGEVVTSILLAGSAPPDEASGVALLESEKDQEEHRFARESVVEALRPFCRTMEVDAQPWLRRLDNVQHLATRVTGVLAESHHVLELVAALHPTAAVGGTPREVALAEIRDLEGMDRSRYAGPIGIVHGNGDGTLGIALRCAQITGTRARLFAGCGIVAASLPEAELEETRLKLNAMQAALGSP